MARSLLSGKVVDLPKREPQAPEPTDLELAIAEIKAALAAVQAAGAQGAGDMRAILEKAVTHFQAATETFERQMASERASRGQADAMHAQMMAVERGARAEAEKRQAELSGRLAEMEASLAAARAEKPIRLAPAEYKLSFARDKDGRIDANSVKIRRE